MRDQSGPPSIDTRPLYMQTASVLRHYLKDGDFKPGDVLPPADVLASQLGVSRSTLREAMALLEQQGWVTRRHGVGTFVSEAARSTILQRLEHFSTLRSQVEARGMQLEIAERKLAHEPASAQMATLLRLEPGTELVHTQSVAVIANARVAYFVNFLLPGLINEADFEDSSLSAVELILITAPHQLSYTSSEISAVNADQETATKLGVKVGRAVLRLDETYYSRSDQPVGLSHDFYVTDFYRCRALRHVDGP